MHRILYVHIVQYEIVAHFTFKLNKNIQYSISSHKILLNTVAISKIQH